MKKSLLFGTIALAIALVGFVFTSCGEGARGSDGIPGQDGVKGPTGSNKPQFEPAKVAFADNFEDAQLLLDIGNTSVAIRGEPTLEAGQTLSIPAGATVVIGYPGSKLDYVGEGTLTPSDFEAKVTLNGTIEFNGVDGVGTPTWTPPRRSALVIAEAGYVKINSGVLFKGGAGTALYTVGQDSFNDLYIGDLYIPTPPITSDVGVVVWNPDTTANRELNEGRINEDLANHFVVYLSDTAGTLQLTAPQVAYGLIVKKADAAISGVNTVEIKANASVTIVEGNLTIGDTATLTVTGADLSSETLSGTASIGGSITVGPTTTQYKLNGTAVIPLILTAGNASGTSPTPGSIILASQDVGAANLSTLTLTGGVEGSGSPVAGATTASTITVSADSTFGTGFTLAKGSYSAQYGANTTTPSIVFTVGTGTTALADTTLENGVNGILEIGNGGSITAPAGSTTDSTVFYAGVYNNDTGSGGGGTYLKGNGYINPGVTYNGLVISRGAKIKTFLNVTPTDAKGLNLVALSGSDGDITNITAPYSDNVTDVEITNPVDNIRLTEDLTGFEGNLELTNAKGLVVTGLQTAAGTLTIGQRTTVKAPKVVLGTTGGTIELTDAVLATVTTGGSTDSILLTGAQDWDRVATPAILALGTRAYGSGPNSTGASLTVSAGKIGDGTNMALAAGTYYATNGASTTSNPAKTVTFVGGKLPADSKLSLDVTPFIISGPEAQIKAGDTIFHQGSYTLSGATASTPTDNIVLDGLGLVTPKGTALSPAGILFGNTQGNIADNNHDLFWDNPANGWIETKTFLDSSPAADKKTGIHQDNIQSLRDVKLTLLNPLVAVSSTLTTGRFAGIIDLGNTASGLTINNNAVFKIEDWTEVWVGNIRLTEGVYTGGYNSTGATDIKTVKITAADGLTVDAGNSLTLSGVGVTQAGVTGTPAQPYVATMITGDVNVYDGIRLTAASATAALTLKTDADAGNTVLTVPASGEVRATGTSTLTFKEGVYTFTRKPGGIATDNNLIESTGTTVNAVGKLEATGLLELSSTGKFTLAQQGYLILTEAGALKGADVTLEKGTFVAEQSLIDFAVDAAGDPGFSATGQLGKQGSVLRLEDGAVVSAATYSVLTLRRTVFDLTGQGANTINVAANAKVILTEGTRTGGSGPDPRTAAGAIFLGREPGKSIAGNVVGADGSPGAGDLITNNDCFKATFAPVAAKIITTASIFTVSGSGATSTFDVN